MKAYESLIKHALTNGKTISVWDGEEWPVQRSTDSKAIIEAVESVDEAELLIREKDGKKVASALVSAYGLADDETVIDWTVCPFMDIWEKHYI